MKERDVKCEVCFKCFKAHHEYIAKTKTSGKRGCYSISDEGVLFKEQFWFCNSCWRELIKYAYEKIDGKR